MMWFDCVLRSHNPTVELLQSTDSLATVFIGYFAPVMDAKYMYCDEYVLSICLSVRSHNSKTTRWINGSKVLIRNSLSRQTYTAKACLLKPKFHGSSFLAASSWFLFTRMLATNLFSLSVCRVVLQIPRARHARTVADMLATRHTILTRWDGLKIARILVTFATRILSVSYTHLTLPTILRV